MSGEAERGDLAKIVRGAGLSLPGTLIGNALSLVLDMYLNRYLALADYGVYGAARRLVLWFGLAGQLGVENDLLRRIARGEGAAALKAALVWSGAASLMVGAAIWAGAGWLGARVGGGEALFLWFAAAVPLAAVRMCAVTASQGWLDIRPRVLVLMLLWPVVQLGVLALTLHRLGLVAAGMAWLAATAAGAAVAVWLLGRQRPGLWAEVRAAALEPAGAVLARCWPMWAQGLLAAGYGYLDQILLPGIGSGEQAGLYGPVAILVPLLGLPLASLNGVFAPIIAARHAEGDREGLALRYRFVIRLAMLGMLPALAPMLVVPEAVIGIWPSGSALAAPAMRIAAAGWAVATAAGSVNYLLLMSGNVRDPLKNGLVAVGVSLPLSLLLIPRYGATGAAIANAAALIAANLSGVWQVWMRLSVHPMHAGLLKVFVVGAITCAALVPVRSISLGWPGLILAGALATLLPPALWLAMRPPEEDRAVFEALLKKLKLKMY